MTGPPRLRMFAGPNGSGKSTLRSVLRPGQMGRSINADDIERDVRSSGVFAWTDHGVSASADEVAAFFHDSSFLRQAGLLAALARLRFASDGIRFGDVTVNSYLASVAADFLRRRLLTQGISFTFETVMSSPDKIDLLTDARSSGYRTYLYYVATEDPLINVSRVGSRVGAGGHDVPRDKIISRYARSLNLLIRAIQATDRAYVFDNSTEGRNCTWIAEITDGRRVVLKTERIPSWFQRHVWDHIDHR